MSIIPSTKINFKDLRKDFFTLDEFGKEWELFKLGDNTDHCVYQERFKAWENHINKGCELENASKPNALKNIGGERIILLNKLLSIIDTKVGMLLSTNSFLLAATGFGRVWLADLLKAQSCHPVAPVISYTSLFFVLVLLIGSLSIALMAFRRVVWGNLEHTPAPQYGDDEQEIKNTGFLIMSVTRRTNKFRISCKLLEWALYAIMIFLCCCGIMLIVNSIPATSCGLNDDLKYCGTRQIGSTRKMSSLQSTPYTAPNARRWCRMLAREESNAFCVNQCAGKA